MLLTKAFLENLSRYIAERQPAPAACAQELDVPSYEIVAACEKSRASPFRRQTDARPAHGAALPIDEYIRRRQKPAFSELLLEHIDRRGLKDSEVYTRAGIDRRLFSKLRGRQHHPSKPTAFSLCLALELTIDETAALLAAAGYSLSDSETFDLVIRYCIEHRTYGLVEVNEALDYFSLKPLGA